MFETGCSKVPNFEDVGVFFFYKIFSVFFVDYEYDIHNLWKTPRIEKRWIFLKIKNHENLGYFVFQRETRNFIINTKSQKN